MKLKSIICFVRHRHNWNKIGTPTCLTCGHSSPCLETPPTPRQLVHRLCLPERHPDYSNFHNVVPSAPIGQVDLERQAELKKHHTPSPLDGVFLIITHR